VGPRAAFLTEAEAHALLVAFLARNGIAYQKNVRVRRAGVEFDADALTPRGTVEIQAADLAEDEVAELEVLKARGELRLLLLNLRDTEYRPGGGPLPDKRGAVRKLLAELERFIE
jgi:hypothetical protein